MPALFGNNADSTLASGITAAATSLTVAAGEGARFPSPTAPDYFLATLAAVDGSGVETDWEVVRVTARSGDTLTVVRAVEAVRGAQTAKAFSAGARVSLRLTARHLSAAMQDWTDQRGANALFGAYGNGDPGWLADHIMQVATAGPTPTQIGTSVLRVVKFRLPCLLDLASVELLCNAATTNLYNFGIYRASDGVRLLDTGLVSSGAAATWLKIAVAAGTVVLQPDTDYWWAVTVPTTGTSAGFMGIRAPGSTTLGLYNRGSGTSLSPLIARNIGIPEYARAVTSAGAMPATLPALEATMLSSAGSGWIPAAWLVGTAS